jgi:tetratricopeptide (TPR) repeat protein
MTTDAHKRILTCKTSLLDLSVLPEDARQPASPAFRDAVSAFLRAQFARLGGAIESLAIDQDEIRVTWAQPARSNPGEPIVAMLNKKQYAEAIPLMELLLSDNPDDTVILYNLGMVYSDRGELARALACLSRLLELEPKNVNGRVALGTALMRQGSSAQALAELRRAVDDDPANPWAQRNLGAALLNMKQPEEGIAHVRRATELNPADLLAWYGLGKALEESGDSVGADKAYHQVIEIDEYGEWGELSRTALTRLAEQTFRSKLPGRQRPDALMYCVEALERFESMPQSEIQKIGFEIAILGAKGLDPNDSARKYQLKSLPGEFTALHLLCVMYVAFKKFAPEQDIGFDLSAEYRSALALHDSKQDREE